MSKRLFLFLAICMFLVQARAQRGSSCPEDLVPKYSQNRQWGYSNLLGMWVIEPIYTKVSPYIENKAVVMKGTLYGVIDCEGNIVLPPRYEMLTDFRYGKIWARQNGLWGLLSDKGKVLLPPQFTNINPIANTEYTWLEKDHVWGLMNEEKGNFICKPQFLKAQIMSENASLVEVANDLFGVVNHVNCQFLITPEISHVKKVAPRIIVFKQQGHWGLFNEMGILRLKPEFDTLFLKYDNVLQGGKNNLHGLYDLTGKELLPAAYEFIGDFSEGYFLVKKGGKFGYTTRLGKTFIQPQYEGAFPFRNKRAVVKQGGLFGIIDIRNQFILPAKYGYIGRNYEAGYFVVQKKDVSGKDKYFLLDKNCKGIVESGVDSVYMSDTAAYTRIKSAGKISFINALTGKNAFPEIFDEALPFKWQVAFVKNGEKWGAVDETGKLVVPMKCDSLSYKFWGGRLLLGTSMDGRVGVTETNGKVVLNNEYTLIAFTPPGLLKLKKDGRYGVMKTSGGEVAPFQYDGMSNAQENPTLPDWPAVVMVKGKYGLLNEKGEKILETKYDLIEYMEEGVFAMKDGKSWTLTDTKGKPLGKQEFDQVQKSAQGMLAVKKGKKWAYVNVRGELVLPFVFEEADGFQDKMAVVKKAGKYGVVDVKGKFIVNPEYESYSRKGAIRELIKAGNSFVLEKRGILHPTK